MFIALTFKLRIVEDAFGSKRMLRRVGIGVIIGSIVYFLWNSASGIPQFATALTCDWVLLHAYLIPIRRFYWTGCIVPDQPQPNVTQLVRFLRTEVGFAEFRAHLEKEFAVESLLFWRDAQQFRLKVERGYGG